MKVREDSTPSANGGTITDSDGQGRIEIDGTALDGGKEKTAGSGIWFSADNKFQYALFTESDGSQTLNIVNLASPGDRIFIKNYRADKNLGIVLQNGPPAVDTTTRIITGDKDYGPDGSAHDDLGNPTGSSTPDSGDYLQGGANNDHVQSLGGDDRIKGLAGDDILEGGSGSDILDGGAGRDRLYGGSETDLAQALALGRTQTGSGLKGDWLNGGSDDDIVIAGADNDVLLGGNGNDILVGGAGDDKMTGGFGVTTYLSGIVVIDGDDYLDGGTGDDWLAGEGGNDRLFGGSGNDQLYGDTASYLQTFAANDKLWRVAA